MAEKRTDGRTDGRTEQAARQQWRKRPIIAKGGRGVNATLDVDVLKAPFPWFGGKSRVAHLVWPRFGYDVPNYVEPFAGSLAVLLARPLECARVETVNDLDCYLANFWRAVQADPDAVAKYCDWPVNEADLHARHRFLVETGAERVKRLMSDPDYFDARIAGEWVYGQCLWIGSGWCAGPSWTGRKDVRNGETVDQRRRPHLTGSQGLHRKMPQTDRGGRGIAGPTIQGQRRPNLGGRGGGQGVHSPTLTRQIPQISGDGSASHRGYLRDGLTDEYTGIPEYLRALSTRLRSVRVICGDYGRVLTFAVTTYIGVTAVFLDPPYQHDLRSICYAEDHDVSGAVRIWALEHGDDPAYRIALCGYEGEHEMPDSWECVAWTAGGGYGRSVRGKANRHLERIWFSPHCLKDEAPLFAAATRQEGLA